MQQIIVTTPEALEAIIHGAFKSFMEQFPGNTVAPSSAEIIDEDTLCTRLNITHPTAGRWRKKGKIPFLQIGSSIRYNWATVLTALENRKSKV
jgi:hypothetical protein